MEFFPFRESCSYKSKRIGRRVDVATGCQVQVRIAVVVAVVGK